MKKNIDKTERAIIEAARRLFMEKGFEQTKMSSIAIRLKISRPKLHYYFRTKDLLFQAVFSEIVSYIMPPVQDILTQQNSFFDKLEQIIEVYFKVFDKYPQMPRFIVNEIDRDLPHLIYTIQALGMTSLLEEAGQVISKEVANGTIKNVPLPIIFMTFYSSLTFPYLSGKLMRQLFFDNDTAFALMKEEWKGHTLTQMRRLLE